MLTLSFFSIASLENELKSKDRIIESLLGSQNALTNSLSTLKAKQPEPIINLSQQQQRQHQKYHHQYHHHHQNIKSTNSSKAKNNDLRSNLKKVRAPANKSSKV